VESSGHVCEVLVDGLDEELAFLCEKELIDQYRRLGYNLVNYTDGGEGWSGRKHTDESKLKMSIAAKQRTNRPKGHHLTDDHKAKLSAAKIGKPAPQKGKRLTDDHKRKLSESHKGKLSNTYWWNNGYVNTRSEHCPGRDWVRGRFKHEHK
jgi:hypothetical protein